MMNWDGSWEAGGWLVMSLMFILVFGVPLTLVVWLVRGSLHAGQRTDPTAPELGADEVLEERYARGEIDEEEFIHRRAVLEGKNKSREPHTPMNS